MKKLLITVALVTICTLSRAETVTNGYILGNSLSWDTVAYWPPDYVGPDGSMQICPAFNTQQFIDGPDCGLFGNKWWMTFPYWDFDYISIQLHAGTTMQQDIDNLSYWISLQPRAKWYIHTGWDHAHLFEHMETIWAANWTGDPATTPMTYHPDYYQEVADRVRLNHPGVRLDIIPHMHLLEEVRQDILNGVGPLTDFQTDLFRDTQHVTYGAGRFLQAQLFLHTVGKPLLPIDNNVKQYLTDKVTGQAYSVPEPSPSVLLLSLLPALFRVRMRRGKSD